MRLRLLIVLCSLNSIAGVGAESTFQRGINQDLVWTKDEQVPALIEAMIPMSWPPGSRARPMPPAWCAIQST